MRKPIGSIDQTTSEPTTFLEFEMEFRVEYMAMDGEVRWTTVEADDAEHAKTVALEKDAMFSCSDNIHTILSVQ